MATLSPPEWHLHWDGQRREPFYCFWGTKSQDSVQKLQPLWRERRAKAESSRASLSAYQPKALPLGQTGSHGRRSAGDCRHNMHLSIPSIVYRPTLHGVRLGGLKIALWSVTCRLLACRLSLLSAINDNPQPSSCDNESFICIHLTRRDIDWTRNRQRWVQGRLGLWAQKRTFVRNLWQFGATTLHLSSDMVIRTGQGSIKGFCCEPVKGRVFRGNIIIYSIIS